MLKIKILFNFNNKVNKVNKNIVLFDRGLISLV